MSHGTILILSQKLKIARSCIKKGGYYYHYKTPNKYYKVIDIAIKEDTEKTCVIYQALDNPELIWVRDVDVWREKVLNENNEYVNRFTEVDIN